MPAQVKWQEFSDWYRALTLAERVQPSAPPAEATNGNKLQVWKDQPPFAEGDAFATRLRQLGLQEEQLEALLQESSQSLRDRMPAPLWPGRLEAAYRSAQPLSPARLSELGLVALAWPLMQQAEAALEQAAADAAIASHPHLDWNELKLSLRQDLQQLLFEILHRTLVLELHVARLRHQLTGETGAARFVSFLHRLVQPAVALEIWREYPVLARRVVERIDQWQLFHLEWLRHFAQDWQALASGAGMTPDSRLVQVQRAGDRHRQGRSVLILTFSSGQRLVYKPRSLAVDGQFQQLLHWLNAQGLEPPLRSLWVLDRGVYGWMEYVWPETCPSLAAVDRFYQRQGAYLALLYFLDATDFHYENLIAAGEHPILIDLESLFQLPAVTVASELSSAGQRILRHSVFRVGLLPQRAFMDAQSEGVDISGLGAGRQLLTPTPVPTWLNAASDTMHLVKRRVAMPVKTNRPQYGDVDIVVADYVDSVVQGFEHTYRLLWRTREAFMQQLQAFRSLEVRYIPRATQVYGRLLFDSYHPNLLRDSLDQERFLDKLWLPVPSQPGLIPFIEAEQCDLRQGDIPYFSTTPGTGQIWDARGRRLPVASFQPSLLQVEARLQQLSEADLTRQSWFVRASFASLAMDAEHSSEPSPQPWLSQAPASTQAMLALACDIGDRLHLLALHEADQVAWLGLTLVHDRYWALAPLGPDLYHGAAGLAFFLGYLGHITGQSAYTDLARQTLHTIWAQLHPAYREVRTIGGFTGLGSTIYALAHLGYLWQEPVWLERAETLALQIGQVIALDNLYDVIGGAAGAILALNALYQVYPSARLAQVARQCGEHLLASARPAGPGVGWSQSDTPPLAGFSHGAAGIATALLTLAEWQQDERYATPGRQALAYERSLFRPEHDNWADLRGAHLAPDSPRFLTAWCHGAPGVGMGRVAIWDAWGDEAIQAEITAALRATQAFGFAHNHSLCHGALGNLDLLLLASQKRPFLAWQQPLHDEAARLAASIHPQRWICGVPQGVETPGLLTGIAGIGYQLLRCAFPQRVPSVLTLASPLKPDW